jgi:PPOX class probable F420-dependent enzyme
MTLRLCERNPLREKEGPTMIAILTEPRRRFALAQRVGHLATTSATGKPHVMPVCYACDGVRFYIAIDEKPKQPGRTLKRVRNIEATGHAALVIDRYDDGDWSRLAWLHVRGTAEMLNPSNPNHPRIIALLRERYAQYETMALEEAPVIVITPERVTNWGAIEG